MFVLSFNIAAELYATSKAVLKGSSTTLEKRKCLSCVSLTTCEDVGFLQLPL